MRRAVLLLIAVAALSCARYRDMGERFGAPTASVNEARIAVGDDPRWAAPALDDRQWQPRSVYGLPSEGRLWLRTGVAFAPGGKTGMPAVYTAMLAPHEVFWDGERIGASGSIATGEAGPMDNFFLIPRERAHVGQHLLAIRIAPHPDAARIRSFVNGIAVGDYQQMLRHRLDEQLVPVAAAAVFVVVGIYFAALWAAAGRSPAVLTFAALCFTSAALAVAEAWRWMAGYTFDRHLPRLMVIGALTYLVTLLLVLFHVFELKLARARVWAALAAVALLAAALLPATYDDRGLAMFRTALVLCVLAMIFGGRSGRRSTGIAIGTGLLGVALITGGYGFSDRGFFLAFCAMVALFLLTTVLEVRRDRRAHESALLRAARLENELLQKSIQPHFVMNTLTAAMEWIEEDPQEGLKFLEAFADELRIFAAVSREPLVPLARELALCRSHLEVMNYRKAVRFRLESDGVDESAPIPPATLHTLVENAITHNRYRGGDVLFSLREERGDGMRRWTFEAPIRGEKRPRKEDGTGLRYVKARLEESFPGRWRFEAGDAGDSWRTTIEVPA